MIDIVQYKRTVANAVRQNRDAIVKFQIVCSDLINEILRITWCVIGQHQKTLSWKQYNNFNIDKQALNLIS